MAQSAFGKTLVDYMRVLQDVHMSVHDFSEFLSKNRLAQPCIAFYTTALAFEVSIAGQMENLKTVRNAFVKELQAVATLAPSVETVYVAAAATLTAFKPPCPERPDSPDSEVGANRITTDLDSD